jgi:Na+-exporting ATPase
VAAVIQILTKYRLVEAVNFETDEALLTGESLPVRKDPALLLDDDTGPGDRLNVAYSSSTVTKGRARGIVFATGLDTEIGSIAAALRATGSKVGDYMLYYNHTQVLT